MSTNSITPATSACGGQDTGYRPQATVEDYTNKHIEVNAKKLDLFYRFAKVKKPGQSVKKTLFTKHYTPGT